MAKKDDIKALKKKLQATKHDLAGAKTENQKLTAELQDLATENFALRRTIDKYNKTKGFYLGEIERLKKKLAEATAPAEPKNKKIGNWNVVKSGGYYRAFRRIDGELKCIYLGKDLRGAAQRIKAREAQL